MALRQQYATVVLLFTCLLTNAQNFSKNLEGKVKSKTKDIPSVHVINKTSKKATITNAYGYFSIQAKPKDTILFSSIQFEKFQLIVDEQVLESKLLKIDLKEVIFELDEILVMPYNLSVDLNKDVQSLKIEPEVSSSSLELPNSHVKKPTLNERKLFLAMQEQGLHKLLDEITGHNKRLRKLVHVDHVELKIQKARKFYPDSLYYQQLKIPLNRIDDFIYFCSVDSSFSSTIESNDKLKLLRFLEKKSLIYRRNNNLQ